VTRVLFSLGRKESDLVLVLICCVTFGKSPSLYVPVRKMGFPEAFSLAHHLRPPNFRWPLSSFRAWDLMG
jgi:hypothetical protein